MNSESFLKNAPQRMNDLLMADFSNLTVEDLKVVNVFQRKFLLGEYINQNLYAAFNKAWKKCMGKKKTK
jgi:hypothetical protein